MVSTPNVAGPSRPASGMQGGSTTMLASRVKTGTLSVTGNTPLSARRAERLDMNTVDWRNRRDPAPRAHIGGVEEAPTFKPTVEDWRDPMEYMRKVADVGRKYGIVKIIPPEGWQPDFAIDTERFHFRTRRQELNSCEGGTRTNLNYLDQLSKFHRQFGTNLTRFPSVDKRPLDLYELKKAVERRGGFERVCKGKKWAEIGRDLGYSGKIMSSLSTSLKNSYAKWLEPYEQWLRGAKPSVHMMLEQERGGPFATPSPGPSPARNSNRDTPSSLPRDSPAIRATQALNISLERSDVSSTTPAAPLIAPRTSGFTAVNSGGFKPINVPTTSFVAVNTPSPAPSEPDRQHPPPSLQIFDTKPIPRAPQASAQMSFDLKRSVPEDDLEDESDRNTDQSGRRSKRLKKEGPPTVTGSQCFQTPRILPSRDRANDKPGDVCEHCGKDSDDQNILLCDGCFHGYHTYCLDPPLSTVPDNDWHCPKCLVGTGEFGFEEGGTYSLKQFQEKAQIFKENHFAGKLPFDPVLNGPRPVSEDDVEREFWRLVSSITETVEVEYGADIHSTTHGSGFPTIEKNPRNAYSTDPWNLNNLPLHKDSLFRYIKTDISGMTVPWLYVGMCFSTFCWHNEDHYTYSANYQHFGATKTWYAIPGEDAARFEDAMREAVPDLFEKQPDLLFQLVTLLTPEHLKKVGVNVYAVDQRAGQLVITFPQAYHAGFNHGFNFNEAVNFAPADWEPYGQLGVLRLREFRRQPCFSHDELLLAAAAAKDITIETAVWLAPALQQVLDRERATRAEFERRVVDNFYFIPIAQFETESHAPRRLKLDRQTDNIDVSEDEYICSYCHAFSYLSRFTCETSKKVACLEHIDLVNCCNEESGHTVHLRLTTNRLEQILQKVWDKARLPQAWTEKFQNAIEGNPKPQLKVLKSLLSEGERIPWIFPQLPDLKVFVEKCNEWVDEAQVYITRKQQNRRKSEKAIRKGSQAKIAEAEERERERERDLRKLDNIKKLLLQADQIGFEAPEISSLQERLDAISQFQQDAHKALEAIEYQKSQDIADLIEVGKSYSVDIPELAHLDKILSQMRWTERAQDTGQGRTLQEVDDLIRDASTLNVPEYNENLKKLKDLKHQGELWEAKAKQLMAAENVHFQQLDSFSKQAAVLPVSRDTLAAIDAILKTQRDAEERITTLYDRSRLEDFRQRPFYKEVRDVMESVNDLNSKPNGTIDLEREQRRHEDWMRRGKKLFGKSNAPLHILLQHMEIVDNHNKACFDLSDQPKEGPIEPSSRGQTPEEGHDGTSGSKGVFCLCRTPEAGLMIECMTCHEWYHSKCLKIARGKVKEDDDFTCPVCDYRVKIPRDANRPRLEELVQWQDEIADLPFQPDEEKILDSIIKTSQAFRDYISIFCNSSAGMVSTQEELPTIRFYLRKLEGADVLLAYESNFFRRELYRLHPIAPDPPPDQDTSLSTRKPRPTKQQKLMAQLGIDNPDEIPQDLRTKPYNVKSRKSQDSVRTQQSPVLSAGTPSVAPQIKRGGQRGTTPTTYNWRGPLTAGSFPPVRSHQHSHSGQPLNASPLSSTSTNPYVAGANISTSLPPFGSPPHFNSAPSLATPPANVDPILFNSGLSSFGDEGGVIRGGHLSSFHDHDPQRPDTAHDHDRDIFGHSGSSHGHNYDTIFADLTNQDDGADGVAALHMDGAPIAGDRGNVDPALLS